ncbi:unnamed protein product [Rotaria sp. Silwood1]|nr:unnamed protein product [Rotaria sp. Silwood1]CAF1656925.1 unnamed protein product [Rotaria sp. Silwood1]CAF4601633.1 unnamed protein product [Rotaria sp. Silwood1]
MHAPSSASGEALNDDAHYINSYNKKLKVAKNKAVALSRNNDDLTTPISAQSSQVWQYAIRCQNSNFSICCLCPNDNKISINNGWTSTLHNNDDIIEPGEHDEIIINIAGDESSEIFDSNDEEQLLFDNSDEECVDNWTTDVIQSDYDTVRKQNMILFVLKKCRGLTSMIKRSTIITLYFDAERKKY